MVTRRRVIHSFHYRRDKLALINPPLHKSTSTFYIIFYL